MLRRCTARTTRERTPGTRCARTFPAAVSAVREAIGFNVPEGEEQVAAYKAAVCAALDVDAAYGFSGGVCDSGTVRLGSLTIEQGQGGSAYEADVSKAVRRALSGSGLLYQGLG